MGDAGPAAHTTDGKPVALSLSSTATSATWHPTAGEVHLDAKQVAAAVAERLTTYESGATSASVAASVTSDPARRQALAAAVAPLVHSASISRGTVVYPQMGGFRPTNLSVMVVVRQQVDGPGGSLVETRTLDIRLVRAGNAWVFDQLASTGGTPVARPASLPPAAVAVVDDPRIQLPDSARWDIYRGAISAPVLVLMEELAARSPFAVTVLESGHPHNVYGTSHTSAHTTGHAVDIFRIGSTDVVDGHATTSAVHDAAAWAYAQPQLDQLGSPWVLGAGGHRSFTDTVHQDHLHIGVPG